MASGDLVTDELIEVRGGATLNINDVTIDGDGNDVVAAVAYRSNGNGAAAAQGTIENVTFTNIIAENVDQAIPPAGTALQLDGQTNVEVIDVTATNIGRYGIYTQGNFVVANFANLTVDGFAYTGGGAGTAEDAKLDYGVFINTGTNATLNEVTITDASGTVNGTSSAGIAVQSFGNGDFANVTISNSTVSGSSAALVAFGVFTNVTLGNGNSFAGNTANQEFYFTTPVIHPH